MREIPLTRGMVALVDDEDYEVFGAYKWYFDGRYVTRAAPWGEVPRKIALHRAIIQPPPGMQVDHINHNTLDNRRSNLRLATVQQNSWNRRFRRSRTGFIGVARMRYGQDKPFKAEITVNGRKVYLGQFATARDAAKAYNVAARNYRGPFAHLNDVEDGNA